MTQREIKFRAWDEENGTFPVTDLHWDKEGNIYNNGHKLMQYTGLQDKNGKEIWEGDVVLNNDQPWEVYYGGGAWRLVLWGDEKRSNDHLLLLEDQHCEVTGNIYEG